jgi:hypothetical protein
VWLGDTSRYAAIANVSDEAETWWGKGRKVAVRNGDQKRRDEKRREEKRRSGKVVEVGAWRAGRA